MRVSLFICLFFLLGSLSAQDYSTKNKKAIKRFESGLEILRMRDFPGAIALFESALEIDPEFIEGYVQIANAAGLLSKMGSIGPDGISYFEKTLDAYQALFERRSNDKRYRTNFYNYAKLLFLKQRYAQSKQIAEAANKLFSLGESGYEKMNFLTKCAVFADSAVQNPVQLQERLLPNTINRFAYNSKPVLTSDEAKMVYCVRNNVGNIDENILIAIKNEKGEWQQGQSIGDNINTPLNEGMASISGDGKTLVYTHCGKKGNCDLYIAHYVGDAWTGPFNMGEVVNTGGWDSEPTLSADGRRIYFASDRKGGYGGFDLYVTKKSQHGTWSQPENLGPAVNTSADEVTPFVHADGKHLYFASKGHVGLGGFDLFETVTDGKRWSKPTNLGYPINSGTNEGALYITPDYQTGYYEKTEVNDIGRAIHSKIYQFDIPDFVKKDNNSTYLKGHVFDASTKKPLEANVALVNLQNSDTVQLVKSDPVTGEYMVVITSGNGYGLEATADLTKYLFYSKHVFVSKAEQLSENLLDIYIPPIEENKSLVLRNIFFEVGSAKLEKQSSYELDLLRELLRSNPHIRLDIEGHTDNQGSADSNMKLSLARAEAVLEYLIAKGVSASRLKTKGYGETKPVASNDSVEGRSQNRRIAFRIIK